MQPPLITTLIIKCVGSATLPSVLSTFDNKAGKRKDSLSFIIFSSSLSDLISNILYNPTPPRHKFLNVSEELCQLISLGGQLRKSLVQHKICLFQKKCTAYLLKKKLSNQSQRIALNFYTVFKVSPENSKSVKISFEAK